MTMRKNTLHLLALAALIGLLPGQAGAISLKESSIITGDSIQLGDIFYDLPHNADKVLGPAPRPGKDMTLNARTLLRIALALDLPWRPSSSSDYIILKRAATIIDGARLKTALEEKAREQGLEGNFRLAFAGAPPEIVLPADQEAHFEITKLKIRPDQSHFEAYVAAPSAENPIHTATFSGFIETLVKVPVLRDPVRAGTIIGQRDIQMIDLRKQDLRHDMIIKAENLLGMTPTRIVMPGQPVRDNEIESPLIVQRGEYVTMAFQSGPLRLTARGKALENGAKGDIIRIVNETSNKTIEAEVTAAKEVLVKTF